MSESPAGRALVTGGAGFVGRYLVSALLEAGWQVTATALDDADSPAPAGFDRQGAEWVFGDLRDGAHVVEAVRVSRPDLVIHLAAVSHLPTAAANPAAAFDINVTASVRLFDELARAHATGTLAPRVLVIGSAEEYGRQGDAGERLQEERPLVPRTVYAATKVAQEVAALQCWRATGLPVMVARAFNHSGAGQESRFLLPALMGRAIALRGAAEDVPLRLGNTSPIRDFLHVRDVVDAYIALARHGEAGVVYNVASGVGRSVREVAEAILTLVGRPTLLEEDPALVRPVDVPSLVGDPSRLIAATGWCQSRSFGDLLNDLLHAATH